MTMLVAVNLQNRIICASDTRISILKPDGAYGVPMDHFLKNVYLNKHVLFMGAGSVQTNCSLANELLKLCSDDDHIQDLLKKLDGQGLADLIMAIQQSNNTFGADSSVTFVLAGMNTEESQKFPAGPVIERMKEARNYAEEEFFLDEGIKTQLESMGATFDDKGPDLSKVPEDGMVSMPERHKSMVVKFEVQINRQAAPTIRKVHCAPFQVCIVAPPMRMGVEQLANEVIYAVEFAEPKPEFVEEMIDGDAKRLLSRFKLLAELGDIGDVVNGGLMFTEILPDKIVTNSGKLWRQKPGTPPEKLTDTKVIGGKLHIYSETLKDYVKMRTYRDPYDAQDYIGGSAQARTSL